MDPQSLTFTPRDDIWRLSSTVQSVQETQQDLADRILRLERRQDEDARMKSVWGPSSPFPGVLSGTPQQGSVHQFDSFDDEQPASMVRSLHLDADDEPRRLGASSRANSVRFDESANQSQWAHGGRSSMDLVRTSSVLSGLGHPLFERTISHKSEGKQSSASQSGMSRANSLGVDTTHPLGQSSLEPPGLPAGLFILGTVPAIIRCWLSTNFKYESQLYAAVCTGSFKSYLDMRLIHKLGFADQITRDSNDDRKIKLPIYLPEAVPAHPTSSRSNSPAPQLPSLIVDFCVVCSDESQMPSKAIQIFLGSDMLRTHNADVLFSSNCVTLFDSGRNKLSIPLVRPESKDTFNTLYVSSGPLPTQRASPTEPDLKPQPSASGFLNGLQAIHKQTATAPPTSNNPKAASSSAHTSESHRSRDSSPGPALPNPAPNPALGLDTTTPLTSSDATPPKEPLTSPTPASASANTAQPTSRTASSPAIWSQWRRDGPSADYASASKSPAGSYARPARGNGAGGDSASGGMKVLKPVRTVSSRAAVAAASPVVATNGAGVGVRHSGDEGRRAEEVGKENVAGAAAVGKARTGTSASAGTGNPVGGSAFPWLVGRK